LLATVMTAVAAVVGYLTKSHCLLNGWGAGRYTHLCYSDIPPLYTWRGLADGAIPYLSDLPADQVLEYPALTGVFVYLRLQTELRRTVDETLRSRADAELLVVEETGSLPLAQPDDAFAQLIGPDGPAGQSSRSNPGPSANCSVTTFLASRRRCACQSGGGSGRWYSAASR